MSDSASTALPTVVVHSGTATVRLSDLGIEWQEREGGDTHCLPYGSVARVSAAAGDGSKGLLRIESASEGSEPPSVLVWECRRNDARAFADAASRQLDPAGRMKAEDIRARREPGLAMALGVTGGLLAFCVLQFLYLRSIHQHAPAGLTVVGFILWLPTGFVLVQAGSGASLMWRAWRDGVHFEASYERGWTSTTRHTDPVSHSSSTTTTTTHLYVFTDVEGRTRRYLSSRPFRPSRTILALPDEDDAVEPSVGAFLSSSVLWLFLSPFLLAVGVLAVVCVPGLLLAQL